MQNSPRATWTCKSGTHIINVMFSTAGKNTTAYNGFPKLSVTDSPDKTHLSKAVTTYHLTYGLGGSNPGHTGERIEC